MRKPVTRKTPVKRKPSVKKKPAFWKGRGSLVLTVFCVLLLVGTIYHYREGLAYYLGFKSHKVAAHSGEEDKRFSDVRNFQLLSKYEDKVAGLDVSQYQGEINWEQVHTLENTFPIGFVFIRATAGTDKVDLQFEKNWVGTKNNKIIRGAYHYYRPNENSLEQATLFIQNVHLQKGDLPPVLDIEKLPKNQSIDSLKVGLKRWLEKIDAHYNVRPIIYTSSTYYDDFLKEEFSDYTFWIANYNFFVEDIKVDWLFWQFTEKSTVSGIKGNVDVTIYNGTPKMLGYLTIN
ncbi:GH25 family lysozyme [Flavobacterium psychrotolerans]|uniref:Glycoside hydrolase n=1 Tax=Flavobacterium psychrotolerans TaxID=2169410 RepID=A0A2U1JRH8_9FLAO|nr:GH25 family lysozyme [Flavobacterium psychrotolerans]PWA07483.1 glycoside hydrolase [Flavobacterium psychrotolerans]